MYTPNPDAIGVDGFTFKVNDGQLDSNTAIVIVNIQVAGINGANDVSAVINGGSGGSLNVFFMIILSLLPALRRTAMFVCR